jgi:hypothetical protein
MRLVPTRRRDPLRVLGPRPSVESWLLVLFFVVFTIGAAVTIADSWLVPQAFFGGR